MDPKSKPSQQEMQLRQQELQIMQQIAQRGTDVSKMLKPDGPPVFLTYNSQMNSIIANAPDEQMKMIEETIRWLDVPLGGDAPGAPSGVAAMVGNRVLRTHKLRTLNPTTFKTTVDDIADLSPFTVVQADQAGQSLVVQGIEADHEKIAKLIKELDGEERKLKVLQLRKYPAADAAVSIRELVFGKAEKKSSDPNEAYYQYLTSMNSRNAQPAKVDPNEGFYVAADELNNRLLVKANTREFEQIYSLLKELGEIPSENSQGMSMRVLDATDGDVLEQIRKIWAQSGGNPLHINGGEAEKPAKPTTDDKEVSGNQPAQPQKDVGVSLQPSTATTSVLARYAAAQVSGGQTGSNPAESASSPATPAPSTATTSNPATTAVSPATPITPPAESSETQAAASGKAPVSISVTPDGRLIIQSSDADAVMKLETLIAEMSPPPQRIKRFPLKHTSASYMLWNLQDVYEEELKGDGETIRDWYGRNVQVGPEGGSGLAKRRKLMITYDGPSNCILVANATNAQLYEIDQLIKELDIPSPEALVRARVTATVKVQYSRASIIAAALKEVYIDLLSTRDSEFATGEQGRSTSSGSRAMTEIKFGDPANGTGTKPPRIPVAFNGELSIGFDDVSNNILISCREELYDGVVAMIHKLDEESAPKMSVVVHAVEGSVGAENLQKTVNDSVGRAWLGGRPEDQATRGGAQRGDAGQRGNAQPPGPRGNRGRRSGNNR
jgi:type II secretory pathway component GspD/PulD (secretin)